VKNGCCDERVGLYWSHHDHFFLRFEYLHIKVVSRTESLGHAYDNVSHVQPRKCKTSLRIVTNYVISAEIGMDRNVYNSRCLSLLDTRPL
jgi:hypothetical protein